MAEAPAVGPWAKAADAMRVRMDELGLTQFELAARSGVSLATIREVLHGRPRQRSPRLLAAVSEALGWPADRLASLLRGAAAGSTAATDGSQRPLPGDV